MSTTWPTIFIFLGAVTIGLGAYVTQWAWNEYGDVRERQAVVSSLALSVEASRDALQNTINRIDQYDEPMVLAKPVFQPVEIVVLSNALSRGVFTGRRFEPLQSQMRITLEALLAYNEASSRARATPMQIETYARRAKGEIELLASLLIGEYGQRQLQDAGD